MHNFLDVSWFMSPNLPRNLKHLKKPDVCKQIIGYPRKYPFFFFETYASCLIVILCQQLPFLLVYKYFYFTCWRYVKCTNSCIRIVQCHCGMGKPLLQIVEQNLKFFIFGKMLCFMCIQQKYVFCKGEVCIFI